MWDEVKYTYVVSQYTLQIRDIRAVNPKPKQDKSHPSYYSTAHMHPINNTLQMKPMLLAPVNKVSGYGNNVGCAVYHVLFIFRFVLVPFLSQ
jgi:hypothetical protein